MTPKDIASKVLNKISEYPAGDLNGTFALLDIQIVCQDALELEHQIEIQKAVESELLKPRIRQLEDLYQTLTFKIDSLKDQNKHLIQASKALLRNYEKCPQNPHNDPTIKLSYLTKLKDALTAVEGQGE